MSPRSLAGRPGSRPIAALDKVAVTMDLFATIADAAGVNAPVRIDGVSFLPTLIGELQSDPAIVDSGRELYFVRRGEALAYGGKTIEALIQGDWKLVQDSHPLNRLNSVSSQDRPRESRNVIHQEPAIARDLAARRSTQTHPEWRPNRLATADAVA